MASTPSRKPPRVFIDSSIFIAAAMQGHSEYLATYDRRRLLSITDEIKKHFDIAVATPDEILSQLQ